MNHGQFTNRVLYIYIYIYIHGGFVQIFKIVVDS